MQLQDLQFVCRKGYLKFPGGTLPLFLQVAPGEHLDDALPQDGALGNARPTGKVVGIIKRNWRTRGYCGSLQPQEERGGRGAQGVLFCPVERRFPKIRLQTRQVGGNPQSQHVFVLQSELACHILYVIPHIALAPGCRLGGSCHEC